MKIVHITPYYPPHLGGMENTVKELAERTAKIGYDVRVYTSNEGCNEKSISKNCVSIHLLKSIEIPGVPLILPMLPFKLLSVIDRNTIVHVHYILNFSIDFAIIISKIKKAKIVSHVHIDPLPLSSLFGFLNPTYKKLFWRRILRLSNAVICQTENYVDIISKKYGVKRDKCVIVSSGINLKKFDKMGECTTSKEIKDILFVGRLSEQKNIPMLLSAFKLIQGNYDITLHIVGAGKERIAINKIITKEKIDNVILHGRVPDEKLMDLYSMSDIFILPSTYESFPLTLLEAMASGLPIVASDILGVRNVLKDCGTLVNPTPENFADAIIKVIEDNDLRRNLIKKGKEKVKDYDWDKITDRVIEIYKEVSRSEYER